MSIFQPGTFIFDIDGTLANNDHREIHLQGGKKDWDSFFSNQIEDTLILPIATILRSLTPYYNIVIHTSRGEEWRDVTERWLSLHQIDYQKLIMRPLNCKEDDTTLKVRQLREYFTIDERMSIMTIFEDRNRVVDALRNEGYHVCHVANTDF